MCNSMHLLMNKHCRAIAETLNKALTPRAENFFSLPQWETSENIDATRYDGNTS